MAPRLRLAACLLAAGAISPATAEVVRVELVAPRAFGYLIGDTFLHEVRITLEPTAALDTASLPRPGPSTYWLHLVTVDLEDLGHFDGGHRYRLLLRYQTFYAPLEPKPLATPALTLMVHDDAERSTVEVPSWPFLMSPLREIVSSRVGASMALQPDVAPHAHDLTLDRWLVSLAGGGAAAALAGLGWLRGWGPFRRKHQPFVRAAREIRRCLGGQRTDAYREALLLLHRAFDAATGRRLLADDVASFLARRPGFHSTATEIALFFAASRQAFFGAGEERAKADFSAASLLALARRLAGFERSGA